MNKHFLTLIGTKLTRISRTILIISIASNSLSISLINLFNESVESGIVPDVFKSRSKVTLSFKTAAVTDPGNYPLVGVFYLLKSFKDWFTIS